MGEKRNGAALMRRAIVALAVTMTCHAGSSELDMEKLAKLSSFSEFIKVIYNRDLKDVSHETFKKMLAIGKALKAKQEKLTKEDVKALHAHAGTSWGDGTEQTWIFYQDAKGKGRGYRIDLRFKPDGSYQLLYDYPMDPNVQEIPDEHMEIFLRLAKGHEFHAMRFKGADVFRKGNLVSRKGVGLISPYLKEKAKDGTHRYVFFESQGAGGHAHVNLALDAKGVVVGFDAMEARYTREIPLPKK